MSRWSLSATLIAPSVALGVALQSCGNSTSATLESRSFRMGFSATPPRLDIQSVLQTIDMWSTRGDAALLALTPPWKAMLADTSPAAIVQRDQVDLVKLYRQRGLAVIAMVDATDGLARDKEAPELVAAGRSI